MRRPRAGTARASTLSRSPSGENTLPRRRDRPPSPPGATRRPAAVARPVMRQAIRSPSNMLTIEDSYLLTTRSEWHCLSVAVRLSCLQKRSAGSVRLGLSWSHGWSGWGETVRWPGSESEARRRIDENLEFASTRCVRPRLSSWDAALASSLPTAHDRRPGRATKRLPAHEGVKMNMNTIGVLEVLVRKPRWISRARIHRVARRPHPPNKNGGYPPNGRLLLPSPSRPPLTEEGKTTIPYSGPTSRLLEAAKRLGNLADFLVITSNTPHLFQAEIEQAAAGRGSPQHNRPDPVKRCGGESGSASASWGSATRCSTPDPLGATQDRVCETLAPGIASLTRQGHLSA